MYKEYVNQLQNVFNKIDPKSLDICFELIKKVIANKKKIFTCGNGGSGYNASHIITDWNKMTYLKQNFKIPCFSLNDNIGLITAWSNDADFKDIFVGQLKSVANSGDLLISLSGSGNSRNTLNAVEYMQKIKCETLSIVGFDGGALKDLSKYVIHIPSFDMQICEDIQMMICHIFMKKLCKEKVNFN